MSAQSLAADATSLQQPGALRFVTDRLPWQRSLRWTPPPRDRRLLLLGLLIALVVTLVELIGFGAGMRAYRHVPPKRSVIDVVLIEPESEISPPPPEPEPPEFVPRPSRIAIEPPKVRSAPPSPRAPETSDAMSARIGTAGTPTTPPKLFNADGSIQLGDADRAIAPAPAPANPLVAAKVRWAEMQQRGHNKLDCKRTRFAQAFKRDESAGDEVARKYLKWIGLGDGAAISHRAEQREQRAADGCDPAQ